MASLELQLEEFEALSATYDAAELTCEAQCDGGIEALRLHGDSGAAAADLPEITLTYSFTLTCDSERPAVLLTIQTPFDYPGHRPPKVHARSEAFTRQSSAEFIVNLHAEVKRLFDEAAGNGLIFSIVQYVMEEAGPFLEVSCNRGGAAGYEVAEAATAPSAEAAEVHRAFVTYHHMLYGNEHKKEQKVVDLAKSMSLSGFIAYGKPSLVCVECCSAEEVQEFLSESKRAGKEGSLTYTQKDIERKCNNGKKGFQQVKAQGKSGETPDQHTIISFLTTLGLKDQRKEITGK